MKVAVKVVLFGVATAAVLVIAALAGMPGARDGERHLAGDYYFTHLSGDQNSITEEKDGVFRVVVDMKVEEFIVHGRGIFVARRPVVEQATESNIRNYLLGNTCEYYRVDVPDRKVFGPFTLAEVKKRSEWNFLKEDRKDRDFGPTMCKLSAVPK